MTLDTLGQQLATWLTLMQHNLVLSLEIIGVLWAAHIINLISGKRLNHFGITPRKPIGLIGIIACPFLHKDWQHLLYNTVALFLLLNLILVYGILLYIQLTLVIILASGSMIWLCGRNAIHIGASGVILGYWGFIVAIAIITRAWLPITIASLCLIYLWGMVMSLLPKAGTSWEGHVFGCLAGVGFACLVNYIGGPVSIG